MFTASHNPAQYNGIKLCRAFAAPVGMETGLGRDPRPGRRAARPRPPRVAGHDQRAGRAGRLRRLPARASRRSPAAASGWSSTPATAWPGSPPRRCSAASTSTSTPLYFELDGTFPNHEANPIEPANLVDLQARVRRDRRRHRPGLRRRRRPLLPGRRARRAGQPERPDRADRRPRAGQGARRDDHPQPDHLARRCRRSSRELGGRPVRTRVGHSFIKAQMAETDAIFGGEHSGHFYFRDFWRADSGMLAALHALAALAETDAAAVGGAGAVRAPRRQRRDQLRGRRPGRRSSTSSRRPGPGATASRWTTSTG